MAENELMFPYLATICIFKWGSKSICSMCIIFTKI